MNALRNIAVSLRLTITIAVIIGLLLPALIGGWITLRQQRDALTAKLQNDQERLAEILVLGGAHPLWDLDKVAAAGLLDSVMRDERVVSLTLSELDKGVFEQRQKPERRRGEIRTLHVPVSYGGNKIGEVKIEMASELLEAQLSKDFRSFFATAAAQLVVSLGLILAILNLRFITPLKRLFVESAKLAKRELDLPFVWPRRDELGMLGNSLESARLALQTSFQQINESEQRFRSLTALSTDWYWETDQEDRLTLVSQGFQEVTGVDPKEWLGTRRVERGNFHYEPENWADYMEKIAAHKPFYELQWRVTRNDGQIRHGVTSGEPVFDAAGHFHGYRGIGRDLTAAKLAEEAQKSAFRLRQLVEHLPAGAIYIEDGNTLLNQAAEKVTGYSRGEIANIAEWIQKVFGSSADGELFRRQYKADRAAGFPLPREVEILRKDGNPATIEFAGYADAHSEVWLLHDISQRKAAQLALEQALLEQSAIFDNAIVGIYYLKNQVIQRCNLGLGQVLGYAPEELIGASTRGIFSSEKSYDDFNRAAHQQISGGQGWIGEWGAVRKDGEQIWCLYHGKVIDPRDLDKGSIWVLQDITERKQTEASLIEAKSRLEIGLAEVEQTYRDVKLLSELSSFLQACATLDEAYAAICEYAPRLLPCDAGALYLMDETHQHLLAALTWGKLTMHEGGMRANQCWALRRGQTYRVGDPKVALYCPHVKAHMRGSDLCDFPYVCIPLIAQGETLGLLYVEHHQHGAGLGLEIRHQLTVALAEQTALALANLRLRETLRRQSVRDPLTGLYNRRYLNEAMQRELARVKRKNTVLAVAIIDVDNFKRFNDTFGHDAGDSVLQSMAAALLGYVREDDVVCRFGGEEFVVILPDLSPEVACQRAYGILERVRKLDLHHGDSALGLITASLGLAFYPAHGVSAEKLIKSADAALYRAKESGRNRVVVADPP